MVVMLLWSYSLDIQKVSHISSSFFVVPHMHMEHCNLIPYVVKIVFNPLNELNQIDARNIRMTHLQLS